MEITSYFLNSSAAWSFLRECEVGGIVAGYPFSTSIEGIGQGWGVRWIDAE